MRLRFALLFTLVGCADPEARCVVSPESFDFGEIELTEQAPMKKLVLRNPRETPQRVSVSALSAPFALRPSDASIFLPERNGEQTFEVRFHPLDGLLHVQDLVFRSEGFCDVTVPLRGLGGGSLLATPFDLVLRRGETQTRELRINNSRRAPVTISVEANPPLTIALPEGSVIPAAGSLSVQVTATLPGWQRLSPVVKITSTRESLSVPINLIPSSPRVEVSPPVIDIPTVAMDLRSTPRGFVERTVRVRNSGSSNDPSAPPLSVDGFFLEFNTGLDDVEVTGAPALLAEGESTQFSVRLVPKSTGPRALSFHLKSSLDDVIVPLTTRSILLLPCQMQVLPADRVALQSVGDGGLEGVVSFLNVGDNVCTVDGAKFTSWTPSGFSISGAPGEQFQVLPREQQQLTIAGPQQPDAGTIGGFGFHVFQTGTDIQWLSLEAP